MKISELNRLVLNNSPAVICSSICLLINSNMYAAMNLYSIKCHSYTVDPLLDTIGTQLAVLYRVVPLVQRYCKFVHKSMWLVLQTVSSLERCPSFRVSFIEKFHCTPHVCMYVCMYVCVSLCMCSH